MKEIHVTDVVIGMKDNQATWWGHMEKDGISTIPKNPCEI
jgi:hypothetical protein